MINPTDTFLYRRINPISKQASNGRASVEQLVDLVEKTIGVDKGVPDGGSSGQVLTKNSDGTYSWQNPISVSLNGIPSGGTTGQVLAKNSNTDFDTEWVDDAGSGVAIGDATVATPGATDSVPFVTSAGDPRRVAGDYWASASSVTTGLGLKLDTTAAPELIRDTMGTALVAGFGAGLAVNDPSDTITVSAVTDVLPTRSSGWLATGSGQTSAAIMSVSGRIFYVPIIIPSPCTIDRIGIHVQTGAASTNAQLGIYGSTATRLPGTKIADCASAISTATAGRLEGTFTVNPVLEAGLYWLAWQSDSTGFTLQPRVITQAALIWVQNSIGTLNYSGEDNATCVEAGNYASGLPTTATPSISLGSDGGSHIRSPVMAVRVV